MPLLRIFAHAIGLMLLIGPVLGQSSPDRSEPEAVVRSLLAAMQANDAPGIRAAFSGNATQAYGSGPAKSGAGFAAWLESDIVEAHGRVDEAQLAVDGNSVVVTGQYRNNKGYASKANFLFQINGGKITGWRMRY
jgi:ketosteroid isomerase-like protein